MSPDVKLFLLSIAIVMHASHAKDPSRIIGGQKSPSLPYQVSLQSSPGQVECGGVILDRRHILTAAHCLGSSINDVNNERLEVVTGTADKNHRSGDNVYQIQQKILHENFTGSYTNDIAILKLSKSIKFNKNRGAIKLPAEDTAVGTTVMASGWGSTAANIAAQKTDPYPRFLQRFFGKVISNKQCQKMILTEAIDQGHLCTWWKGHGTFCKGDSGGPLVDGSTVVGITSFNELCNPNYPNVYTRVYYYRDWIQKALLK